MKIWQPIIIILILVGLLFAIGFIARNNAEENHSAFDEPGVCPNCGTPLVKGVYGQFSPIFVWYCPNCP